MARCMFRVRGRFRRDFVGLNSFTILLLIIFRLINSFEIKKKVKGTPTRILIKIVHIMKVI